LSIPPLPQLELFFKKDIAATYEQSPIICIQRLSHTLVNQKKKNIYHDVEQQWTANASLQSSILHPMNI
jgi:hypothetical protein